MSNIKKQIIKMAREAKEASRVLAVLPPGVKNQALKKMARALIVKKRYLIQENRRDLTAARKAGYSNALVDRLVLNDKVIKGMAQCLLETAKLKDPVGEVIKTLKRPNGLVIKKVRTPIGLIGIIYESRPNVTSDCIGLCLKSGNASVLKGGKEALYSNKAIFKVLRDALKGTRVPLSAINLISSVDRKAVHIFLRLDKYVDLIVPRGGEGLIRFVAENSSIPVVKHYKGVCHTYVSDRANLKMAHDICMNAKTQRPGVCNAMETMLVNKKVALKFLPSVLKDMRKSGVEIRGCPITRRIVKDGIKKATEKDWEEEYLDLILSVLTLAQVSG